MYKKSPENFSLAGSSSNTPFQVFLSTRGPKNCPTMTKISRDQDFEKSKTHKNNRQNSENNIFTKDGTYVERYTAGHLCTKFEEFILIYEAMIAKNGFDLLLAVN